MCYGKPITVISDMQLMYTHCVTVSHLHDHDAPLGQYAGGLVAPSEPADVQAVDVDQAERDRKVDAEPHPAAQQQQWRNKHC
jgi:hypothetical protein